MQRVKTASVAAPGQAARRHRLHWRLVSHHIWLAAGSLALVLAVRAVIRDGGDSEMHGLSLATAYVGLLLLACTLLIGPVNVLRRRPSPLSHDLRRDIGIWAGVLAVVHTFFGLQVHLGGDVWAYFLTGQGYDPDRLPRALRSVARVVPFRLDAFGLANHTGLLATLIALGLLTLSNDLSMRKLGKRRWKWLQRLNYLLLLLVVAHGIVYQTLEGREQLWVLVFAVLWTAALSLQLVGAWTILARAARVSKTAAHGSKLG